MPTDGELSAGMGDAFGVVVRGLDDSEFGTLGVSTNSLRSTVASEETDVSVMFEGDVDITGTIVGSCAESNYGMHGSPALYAGSRCRGGCGEAIGKFGVGRFKMLCRSKKCRSLIGPKDGQDGWTSEQRYAEH